MSALYVFKWVFTPPDYFEEPYEISRDEYVMRIDIGTVEAKVSEESYDAEPNMRELLHSALNDRFLGVQLLTFQPYELS